ncbi:transcriptional repressor [Pseudodesulfovibrio sp. S3]|nr:Fur family transcriptional regulator [Pseudodesulfovibrio sp. S3-i]MCJ2163369.1 transcriptional repressor [Pseudodesulfovibrio sp. S3-i]RWU06608.1 transcriptional repressor [Pseudodesulfovibrio sp. S3]
MSFITFMSKSAEQMFVEYLQKSNLSVTPQRKVIVETFLEAEGHFSAEELCSLVKGKAVDIGQATIYRTLKLLVDSGLADAFDPGDGVSLYEHSYNHAHHDHFICAHCGKTLEICDAVIEERQERVAEEHGFELTRHRMFLFGVCSDCRFDEK